MPRSTKRKYVKVQQSMQSFLEPMPSERLIWLAKMALDIVVLRGEDERLNKRTTLAEVETRVLQAHGRTLR